MGRLNRGDLAYPLELTPPRPFGQRGGIIVGAICGGEIEEVVANPGREFVHETFRIGNTKGDWDGGGIADGLMRNGVELGDVTSATRDLCHTEILSLCLIRYLTAGFEVRTVGAAESMALGSIDSASRPAWLVSY